MNPGPLYALLDRNAAPPRAKVVILHLIVHGTCKVTPAHFAIDPELRALAELKLVALQAGCLVVAQEAFRLVGVTPPSTSVEIV